MIKNSLIVMIIAIITSIVSYLFINSVNYIISIDLRYLAFLIPIIYIVIDKVILFNKSVRGSTKSMRNSAIKNNSNLSILIIPTQFIATCLSMLVGASVSTIGVGAQYGAVIGSKFNKKSSTNFTLIGISIGFTALTSSVLAGVFFAFEITNKKYNKDLGYCLLGSIITKIIMVYSGISYSIYKLNVIEFRVIPYIVITSMIILFSYVFVKSLIKMKAIFNDSSNIYSKLIGLFVIFIIVFVSNFKYSDTSTYFLADISVGYIPSIIDVLFKSFLSILSIAIGFVGGELTILLVVGSLIGGFLANMFAINIMAYSILGYGLMFANATKAYIAAAFLVLTIFGINGFVFVIPGLLVSRFINYKNSIY